MLASSHPDPAYPAPDCHAPPVDDRWDRTIHWKRAVGANCEIPGALQTVEEGKRLRGEMRGTFTKNLLLRDKKGRLFLFSIHEDRVLDLKTLHQRVGANGRLGFAPAERMVELLGVQPGALTPLGLINDAQGLVTAVIDALLLDAEQVNFHPFINIESTGLRPDDLLSFLRSCNRELLLVGFDTANAAG